MVRLFEQIGTHLLGDRASLGNELLCITTGCFDLAALLVEQTLRFFAIVFGGGQRILERLLSLLDCAENGREGPFLEHEVKNAEDDQRPEHEIDAERHERRRRLGFLGEQAGRVPDRQRERKQQRAHVRLGVKS